VYNSATTNKESIRSTDATLLRRRSRNSNDDDVEVDGSNSFAVTCPEPQEDLAAKQPMQHLKHRLRESDELLLQVTQLGKLNTLASLTMRTAAATTGPPTTRETVRDATSIARTSDDAASLKRTPAAISPMPHIIRGPTAALPSPKKDQIRRHHQDRDKLKSEPATPSLSLLVQLLAPAKMTRCHLPLLLRPPA